MSIYLITGGAGFIGSHLANTLLRAGHEVRVVDDLSTGCRESLEPAVELIEGDVADVALMWRAADGVAGVFHLAATTSAARCREQWPAAHRTNQAGSVAVFDAARERGQIPVCYASSAAVYGDQGHRAIQEGTRARPMTALGTDKLGSEFQAAIAFRAHGVPNLGLRMFHAYGPRSAIQPPYPDVVATFAARILAGQVITLHGDGLQSRDFVHVFDVVRYFFAGMQVLQRKPQSLVLNLCTGRATSIRGLADLMGVVAARVPLVQFGPARAGDPRALLGDPNEAIHVLGVEAGIDLEAGLRSLLPVVAPPAPGWLRHAPPASMGITQMAQPHPVPAAMPPADRAIARLRAG